jgi:hypothetical protein
MPAKKTEVAAKSVAVASKKRETLATPKVTGVQCLRELLATDPTLSQADLTVSAPIISPPA